jgi:hypothetical protein
MQKIAFWLLSIIGLIGCSIANAEVTVSIQAIESEVWLQQGDARSKLQLGSQVKPGEIIITGTDGQITLQLAKTTIQISSNSKVIFNGSNRDEVSTTELLVHKGQVCVQYRPDVYSNNQIKLNIGDTMYIAMSYSGDICASRLDSQSSIELLNGSAQITHFVDPSLIILSQAGTAFKIEDSGAYQLTVPGVDEPLISEAVVIDKPETVTAENIATNTDVNKPDGNDVTSSALMTPVDENQTSEDFLVLENATANKTDTPVKITLEPEVESTADNKITEEIGDKVSEPDNISDEMLATIDPYISNTQSPAIVIPFPIKEENPEPIVEKSKSETIYTVYLFSARSEEVARKANRKFQKAKLNTEIITNNSDSVTRFRVAVSGFKSLQAAKDFSSSIVGKHGIKDTWIGKQ